MHCHSGFLTSFFAFEVQFFIFCVRCVRHHAAPGGVVRYFKAEQKDVLLSENYFFPDMLLNALMLNTNLFTTQIDHEKATPSF